jgi:hypothetical protein
MVSLVVSAGLTAFGNYLNSLFPFVALVLSILNVAVSLLLISLLFAAIYKVLPDRHLQWRDVILGAVVTAVQHVALLAELPRLRWLMLPSRTSRSIRARASQGQALRVAAKTRPALTGPARGGCEIWRSGRKNARGAGRTKEWDEPARKMPAARTNGKPAQSRVASQIAAPECRARLPPLPHRRLSLGQRQARQRPVYRSRRRYGVDRTDG